MSETVDRIFERYFEKKREIDRKYGKFHEIVRMMEKKNWIKEDESIESYVIKKYENEMTNMKDELWEGMTIHYDLIVTFLEKEKKERRHNQFDDVPDGYVPDYIDNSVFFYE